MYRRCPPLPKTAPLVYNIHSEPDILSFELFLPSPLPKRAFANEADGVSLAEDWTSSHPLLLITPDIPNQAKQALCLRLSHEYRCWFEITGHRSTVTAAVQSNG